MIINLLFCLHLPPTRAKYITIRTNTDDRKDHFKHCFHNKHVFDQLDTNIHIPDPNYNYEILEHALKETHSECFPERRVRFNDRKHKKTPWITKTKTITKTITKTKIDPPNYITNKQI